MPDDDQESAAEQTMIGVARRTEAALSQITGIDTTERDDLITVPIVLPTPLARVIALLADHGDTSVLTLHASLIMRGLWALSQDQQDDKLASVVAVLIHEYAATEDWDRWSARHPGAAAHVAAFEAAGGEQEEADGDAEKGASRT